MRRLYLCLSILLTTPACIKRPEIGTCVTVVYGAFAGKVGRVAGFTGRFTLVENSAHTYAVYGEQIEIIPEKYCEE